MMRSRRAMMKENSLPCLYSPVNHMRYTRKVARMMKASATAAAAAAAAKTKK